MPLTESQLQAWTGQGGITASRDTHAAVRVALDRYMEIDSSKYEIYLQGSYKNDTNIRGDSDVDIVVQLNNTSGYDVAGLPLAQQSAFHQAYGDSNYQWSDFRDDVFRALVRYFGATEVQQGKKSIKLRAAPGRNAADVVPAFHYRRYEWFERPGSEGFADGIRFYHRDTLEAIVNFPKLHYQNGTALNAITSNYKPSIRLFKNARNVAVAKGLLGANVAPSYFIEGALSNVPSTLFTASRLETFYGVLAYMEQASMLWSTWRTQNRQHLLLGATSVQWSPDALRGFLSAMRSLSK